VNENDGQIQERPEVALEQVVGAQPKVAAEPTAPLSVLRMKHHVGGGAFADVFRYPDNGRVHKVFRKQQHNNLLGDDHGEHELVLRRAVFQAERDAYFIATHNDAIRPFVPAYHGPTRVGRVLVAAGEDISDRYLLDCCYVIDFVDGEAAKLTQNLANQHPHLLAVTQAFAENGVNHWQDGAVFHPSDPARTKIIDFGTKDAYHEGELDLIMPE
jgi:hypothetical protein